MPRNGSGTFTRVHNWVADAASNVKINASRTDADTDDIAAAITASIAKDGQTNPTANLPMATYRHTGVGAGVDATDYARLDQLQGQHGVWCGTAGGTVDALTLTPSPAITAYAAGQRFQFIAAGTNTGPVTVNVSGLGVKDLKPNYLGDLRADDLNAGEIHTIVYDGTQFLREDGARGFVAVNSNGTAWGLDIGVMIAYKVLTFTYSDATTLTATWTYPVEFATGTFQTVLPRNYTFSNGGSGASFTDIAGPYSSSSSNSTSVTLGFKLINGATSFSAATTLDALCIAIAGRNATVGP